MPLSPFKVTLNTKPLEINNNENLAKSTIEADKTQRILINNQHIKQNHSLLSRSESTIGGSQSYNQLTQSKNTSKMTKEDFEF